MLHDPAMKTAKVRDGQASASNRGIIPYPRKDVNRYFPENTIRFRKDQMACPYCGARFNGRVTDEEEFIFEEDELEAWDEEDGV